MGDVSVILEGVDTEESRSSFFTTIHGAGRCMGRTAAKGKVCRKTGKQLSEGLVKKEEHEAWMRNAGVELRGGGLDESPFAYKRIEDVLRSHAATVKIIHTLKPIGVVMADARERDPYKD